MKWAPYVMVRITMFFIIGILAGIFLPHTFTIEGCTVFLIVLTFLYFSMRGMLKRHTRIRITSGFVGLLFVLISGYLVVGLRDESRREDAISRMDSKALAFRARISSTAERRENAWRQTARVTHIRTTDGWIACQGQVMMYWPLEEQPDTLKYGTSVLLKDELMPVMGPQNPDEFDYRQYLARRNIHHQCFVRPGTWTVEQQSQAVGLLYYALQARRAITKIIDDLLPGDRERAIVKAFTVGITSGIDDELRQAYAAGGAMHVLAVSGMHVSILYGVLLLLLKPVERRRGGRWTIALVSLVVLWSYAFVTGLPPSVLRAVGMFSFVAVAKPLRRSTSIINTLAASAFFLLMFDPYLILSAGFQLSYLAVLGIVLFYRPIYNLLEPKSRLLNWAWQIACVSLSAQLATLPVTLFYFHQFPVYFLLANLFVMPLATLILLGGIGLLAVSPINGVALWVGKGLAFLVCLLNSGLFLIARLPGSLYFPVSLTLVQVFCLAGVIISGYLLLKSRRFPFVVSGAVFALIFFYEDYPVQKESKAAFVVYRVNRHAALEWFDDRRSFSWLDSSLVADADRMGYHIEPHRLARGITRSKLQVLDKNTQANLAVFRSRSFLRIQSAGFLSHGPIRTNYLVIGRNGVKSLETLSRTITFDYIVLDSSNSPGYAKRIAEEAMKMGYKCHSVLTDGALVVKL